ncbi:MAG TPA: hypothetical protein VFY79_11340 [Dehalococcoidia bacterium]|nr:hypothetical protein [Dehalococcoidia bacterium]
MNIGQGAGVVLANGLPFHDAPDAHLHIIPRTIGDAFTARAFAPDQRLSPRRRELDDIAHVIEPVPAVDTSAPNDN